MAADNDWLVVVNNLSRARAVWRRMLRILSRERAAPRVSGFLLNAAVQVVLIFRSDTWVVTSRMGKDLGGGSGTGGKTDAAPAEDTKREVEIHLHGDGTGGGGSLVGVGIHEASLEHGCIVHCYAITVSPV